MLEAFKFVFEATADDWKALVIKYKAYLITFAVAFVLGAITF